MDSIKICAKKSDGKVYRESFATVIEERPNRIVAYQEAGAEISQNGEIWYTPNNVFLYFWFDRPFNLFEAYHTNGEKNDLYLNIASPAKFKHSVITYTDYELDLELKVDGEIELKDEDEFIIARQEYSYSDDFVQECYKWVEQGKELLNNWTWRGWK
ncbi:DUF402 domain-containing protein [Filobacillus milosensis]|uniref:DUF402 domain-containing protein n=1 Tax=Filobacillus milosensis TaxID=94137 RepID=A0A4Y8ING6_9BACI|nr:DUF402 domain-containing protein [Filobacillus milosensis]TFB22881.1 DUF402 domain-containing protein [Filobacillus milosensis]